jgi:hypothetical protein
MTSRKLSFSQCTVTISPACVIPTWIFCLATIMPPRLDTRRCTVTAASGSGAGPARRAPCSRCRWPGGIGQGRVRHSLPSWVSTCISCPSRRIRARCPASGEPTRISRFSRVTPPMPLTSRSTSTHRLAARAPGDGPAGGGPAGRASARRSRARSTSVSREGTVLTRHPPMLRCTVVVSIQRVTCCPARAGLSQNCWPLTHMFPDGGTTRSTSTASGQLAGSAAAAVSSAAGGVVVRGSRSAGAHRDSPSSTACAEGRNLDPGVAMSSDWCGRSWLYS